MTIESSSSRNNQTDPHSSDRSLVTTSQQHLPSTEVRATMPLPDEEVHLRDYFDVLLRRKWAVIIFLLVTFFFVAVGTFTTEPVFKSTGVIKISAQGQSLTDLGSSGRDYRSSSELFEMFETQVQLLQRTKLIKRTIDVLGLKNNKAFFGSGDDIQEDIEGDQGLFSRLMKSYSAIKTKIKNSIKSVVSSVKGLILPPSQSGSSSEPASRGKKVLAEYSLEEGLVNKFRRRLTVIPIPDTQLIQISFESSSGSLAKKVVDEYIKQFIKIRLETNVDSYKVANAFLEKQIQVAKVKLEESEKRFNKFARSAGIISMDAGNNLILRQLAEINNALALARSERIIKESFYRQSMKEGGENLPQVLNNSLIQQLKEQYATYFAEYQDLSTTFKPGYPKVRQLKAKMDDLKSQYEQLITRITDSIKNEYEVALENENRLQANLDSQKGLAMELNEKSIEYNILLREVEANKEIYRHLLQRSNQVEASVGSDVDNVEIVDPAVMPTRPFKPKTFRNLLLGIVLGLAGGVGAAFLLEFFDNTVKKPDEFVHRYHIPILGLVPTDEEPAVDDISIAFKVMNDPKSSLSEAIRTAMVSIKLSSVHQNLKTILVTSVLPDAGKSTISTNLALSMLSDTSKVLLIDTDMRKPTLHRFFRHVENNVGLSSFLSGIGKVGDIILDSGIENLYFVPSGPVPINPAELVASSRMRAFLKSMTEKFDHIVIDTPPFHGFAEILILANMVDGVILISELNKTPRDGLQYFRQAVTNVNGNILGAMINKVTVKGNYGYGSYGRYGGSYGYGRE